MARERNPTIVPPIGGVRRRDDYQNQAPFTAFDAINARGIDTAERRVRVGSRPTTKRAFAEELGSGNPVRMLQTVEVAPGDAQITYEDHFPSNTSNVEYESDAWTTAPHLAARPHTLAPSSVKNQGNPNLHVGLVHTGLTIDVTKNYVISIPITIDAQGKEWEIFVRTGSDDDPTNNGIVVRVRLFNGSNPTNLDGEVNVYVGGIITETRALLGNPYTDGNTNDLEVSVTTDTVRVTFGGTSIMALPLVLSAADHAALTSQRFGFGLKGFDVDPIVSAIIDAFRVRYTSSVNIVDRKRNILVASSNKLLYSEATVGSLATVSSTGFTGTIGID
ncbi:hypothetical protein LCGC14_2614500, partial [marine sediment metagenome]